VTAKKRNKPYRPRLIRAPVMRELHDEIAMGLHTAYGTLACAPDRNAIEMLAQILGMIGLAVEGEERFANGLRQIDSGMRALEQIGAKTGELTATKLELAPILNAVRTADAMLPRLDVVKLHLANVKLTAMSVA
jgi:hypothetical protein